MCFFLLFQLVIVVQPITFWKKHSPGAGSLCLWQCFLLYFPLNSLDNFVIWYSLLLDQLDIWWALKFEMPRTWQVTLWQRNYNIKMEQICRTSWKTDKFVFNKWFTLDILQRSHHFWRSVPSQSAWIRQNFPKQFLVLYAHLRKLLLTILCN